jgi:hypothetical protein
VYDLLLPLAWAEGLGLPWADIWAPLASALSGRTYTDEDIHWVLENAGSFIVESLEQGRSVYRLYHQALADYLRRTPNAAEIQRHITVALIHAVTLLPDGKGKDWRLAPRYVLAHLPEHAVACGMLPDLSKDPLFLLSVDPDRLIAAMNRRAKDLSSPIMRAYESALHQVRAKPLFEAASYLEVEARKCEVAEFADQVAQLPLEWLWNAPWVQWMPALKGQVRFQAKSAVSALAPTSLYHRAMVVYATYDGSLQIVDLEHGEQTGPAIVGHTAAVNSLAAAELFGRAVILSGSDDGSIRIWDVDRREQCCAPLTGRTAGVKALVVGKWQEKHVVVSGNSDGTIRIWDIERGEQISAPFGAHAGGVSALAVAVRRGLSVIVSGGWDNEIRIWDLESGKSMGTSIIGHRLEVTALAVVAHGGRQFIVSGSDDNTIRVGDLESGEPIGAPVNRHTFWVRALAAGEWQKRTVIVSGSWDNTICVWDLMSRELLRTIEVGAPLFSIMFVAPSTIVAGTNMGLIALQLH